MQASHGRLRCPARGLRGRGWRPRAVRLPRAYPACTSRSQSGMAVLGFGERPPGALVRSVQGCSECPPRLRPVPSAGSSRARAAPSPLVLLPPPRGVYIGHAPGLGCTSRGSRCPTRPATVQRDPRAGGARAHRDARRGSTWSRDPPGHAPHARRARGGRARAPRWGLGGGIQRSVRLQPVLWVPRPSGVLGWLS